jgi:3-phosphoinositide dependent protein kinase-1
MPEGLSEAAADLIRCLLHVDPAQRIGAEDLEELKAHPFFDGIDWAALRCQPAPDFIAEPSLDPALSSANSSFDWELQSLASALPHVASTEDTLTLE